MKFNASMLKTWESCQLQARYKYIDQISSGGNGVHSKTVFGSIIHKVFEEYDDPKGEHEGDEEYAIESFKSLWSNPTERIGSWRGTQFGTLRTKGINVIENYCQNQRWGEHRQVLATEWKFCVPIGKHILSGVVDLLTFENSSQGTPTLVIRDHKLTSSKPSIEELRFDLQFSCYLYASLQPEFWIGFVEEENDENKYPPMENGAELYEEFKDTPRRIIWDHNWTGVEIDAGDRTEQDFERMFFLLDSIENAIDKEVFIPSISASSCNWCSFKEICPAVSPVLKEMHLPFPEKF